ncbi:MAG: hypothetical protein JSV76_02820 [Candidatus Bathyarchaeota archaeon]|nr:MAG: hypothetical protein JSV76_02820 [Candidatus Bathyarchaeota archaeon]
MSTTNVKVTPKDDGAIITVNGFDIVITIQPSDRSLRIPRPDLITLEYLRIRLDQFLPELDIRDGELDIVVEPKSFLGRDVFAAVATIIEELGGRYVSAGRESRFVIPKTLGNRLSSMS